MRSHISFLHIGSLDMLVDVACGPDFLPYSMSGLRRRSQSHLCGWLVDSRIVEPSRSCPWLALFLGQSFSPDSKSFGGLTGSLGLSLGDRHLENILLDENTGDAIHVDFNCLFEKVSVVRSITNFSSDFISASVDRVKHWTYLNVFHSVLRTIWSTVWVLPESKVRICRRSHRCKAHTDLPPRCLPTCLREHLAASSRQQGHADERLGRFHPRSSGRMGRREAKAGTSEAPTASCRSTELNIWLIFAFIVGGIQDRQAEKRYPRNAKARASDANSNAVKDSADLRSLAKNALHPIEKKLKGQYSTSKERAEKEISTSNLVQMLIQEATSPANLVRIFLRWVWLYDADDDVGQDVRWLGTVSLIDFFLIFFCLRGRVGIWYTRAR